MMFTSFTLFALLGAVLPTAAPTKLSQLLTVPIYTDWTEGTVSVLGNGANPVDLAKLNGGTKTFPNEGDYQHVTAFSFDRTDSPVEFDIRGRDSLPLGEYQHCTFTVESDPKVSGLNIILAGPAANEVKKVIGEGMEQVKFECEWRNK